MDYKKLMGYSEKKKTPKPKVNEVLNSIKEEFGYKQDTIKEGPAYEYRKDIKTIDKSYKLYGKSILNLYDKLRKKGLNDEASNLLDTYKKNIVSFKKNYDKIVDKLL